MTSSLPPQASGLSNAQRIHVCRLARRAWAVWSGRFEAIRLHGSQAKAFAEWRHEQTTIAVGVASLNHCAAADYPSLVEHFHRVRMVLLQDAAIAYR